MGMTTYVGIVKAKMKWTKPTVSPAALARLFLVGLGSHMKLRLPGGVDWLPTEVEVLE